MVMESLRHPLDLLGPLDLQVSWTPNSQTMNKQKENQKFNIAYIHLEETAADINQSVEQLLDA